VTDRRGAPWGPTAWAVRIRKGMEDFRGSLFFLPALFVLLAIAAAEGLLAMDARIDDDALPRFLRSTVDSARAVLSTVAGATITVAGIVFSVTVLTVQLTSSQFSPRILRSFFRDRFQQSVMGFLVGTFTYCLLVLRSVRAPGDGRADGPIVPNLSVAVAVVLAVLVALAILAFINRAAQLLQVGQLVDRITGETLERVREIERPHEDDGELQPEPAVSIPGEGGHVIRATAGGWVQQVSARELLDVVAPGGTLRLDTRVGWFVAEGTPLCTVWPRPEDPERAAHEAQEAVALGRVRTMQQDVAFGIRQLVDVALRALSPGINDPTTAHEVVVHLGSILREILLRDLPPTVFRDEAGRTLVFPHELSHGDYVVRAFAQIRHAGARQPAVALFTLRTMGMLRGEMRAAGLEERAGPIVEEARLVLQELEAGRALPEDVERVRDVARAEGLVPG
jgi:uncharacterized membrane protein